MLSAAPEQYYAALQARDSAYEGLFFVAVKTTGIFCRPTCPARTPLLRNCEFYETAQQALLAGYRPCKRCLPLSHPRQMPELVQALVAAVEAEPTKRWRDADFRAFFTDASTARRQFKKRFGMTFVAYARARRMSIALREIRAGASALDAQLASGYESSSGFRDAFSRIMGAPPARAGEARVLKAAWFDAQLGPMLAVADEEALYLLEFVDRRGLEREIERMRRRLNAAIVPGSSAPLSQIEDEIGAYFGGRLRCFETPIAPPGSAFQQAVWSALRAIPYGETRTYAQLAAAIGRPEALRAVGAANGANTLAILVPCHRILGTDGSLTGYGGGLSRKQWLLDHERATAGAMH